MVRRLGDEGGPVDLSVGDGVWGEGGVDGVEARWLESVDDDDIRRGYRRAKGNVPQSYLCNKTCRETDQCAGLVLPLSFLSSARYVIRNGSLRPLKTGNSTTPLSPSRPTSPSPST